MHLTKEHIVYKVLTTMLVFTLLIPASVNFAHVFEHHEHEFCQGGDTTHIHEVDLDCEFQKFQINTNFILSDLTFQPPQIQESEKAIESQYHYLSKYQNLHFSLRGPPALV